MRINALAHSKRAINLSHSISTQLLLRISLCETVQNTEQNAAASSWPSRRSACEISPLLLWRSFDKSEKNNPSASVSSSQTCGSCYGKEGRLERRWYPDALITDSACLELGGSKTHEFLSLTSLYSVPCKEIGVLSLNKKLDTSRTPIKVLSSVRADISRFSDSSNWHCSQ